MRTTVADPGFLRDSVSWVIGGSVGAQALGVKAHAPAAAENPVVALDKLRERVPCRRVERPDRVRKLRLLTIRNAHIRNPADRKVNCSCDGRCHPAGVNDVEQCADREPADTVTSTSTV